MKLEGEEVRLVRECKGMQGGLAAGEREGEEEMGVLGERRHSLSNSAAVGGVSDGLIRLTLYVHSVVYFIADTVTL